MLRTIALAALLATTVIALSGTTHSDAFVADVSAECAPVLIDDGSGDECRNSCDDAEKVHTLYRKVTGDEIYCTQ